MGFWERWINYVRFTSRFEFPHGTRRWHRHDLISQKKGCLTDGLLLQGLVSSSPMKGMLGTNSLVFSFKHASFLPSCSQRQSLLVWNLECVMTCMRNYHNLVPTPWKQLFFLPWALTPPPLLSLFPLAICKTSELFFDSLANDDYLWKNEQRQVSLSGAFCVFYSEAGGWLSWHSDSSQWNVSLHLVALLPPCFVSLFLYTVGILFILGGDLWRSMWHRNLCDQ